ncbi:MAG TPA: type II secretion system protein GspG [Candidatus Baltobacteraceae bacterium]|jgi:general secretion pathway protein G|nr:type II secretion system protein GspG [Candidatus Baltobacteraceae bacterium]
MNRKYIAAILIILFVTVLVLLRNPVRRSILHAHRPKETLAINFSFKIALKDFQVDCGRLPTTTEGLRALLKRPPTLPAGANWLGPYLNAIDVPKDRWGHEYVYRCPGRHNPDEFDVFSCGPDGIPDTVDDIGNWTRPVK